MQLIFLFFMNLYYTFLYPYSAHVIINVLYKYVQWKLILNEYLLKLILWLRNLRE